MKGIEVVRGIHGLVLNQRKYVLDLISKTCTMGSKTISILQWNPIVS